MWLTSGSVDMGAVDQVGRGLYSCCPCTEFALLIEVTSFWLHCDSVPDLHGHMTYKPFWLEVLSMNPRVLCKFLA